MKGVSDEKSLLVLIKLVKIQALSIMLASRVMDMFDAIKKIIREKLEELSSLPAAQTLRKKVAYAYKKRLLFSLHVALLEV